MLRLAAPDLEGHLSVAPTPGPDPLVVVDGADEVPPGVLQQLAGRPEVLVGLGGGPLDLVLDHEDELAEVEATVAANPVAATAMAVLLRGGEQRSVAEGLVAESATYSLLQAGDEARRWLAERGPARQGEPSPGDPVRIERRGDELRLTLDRPEVRNAFSAAMREGLLDGLAVAAASPELQVVVEGAGSSFCSGGDLREFGTAADPASAHVVRLARSVGRALHELSDRTTVHVHGACVGAGVELPAFASRVVAAPDARFRLPEVAMGLVPGAGGTVSLPRRVGRQRTAWLALTGRWLDATTALEWGLVDELVDGHAPST